MRNKKIISLAVASALVILVAFSSVVICANDSENEKGEFVNASTQEQITLEVSESAHEDITCNEQVLVSEEEPSTDLASENTIIYNERNTTDKSENKPHPNVPEETEATTTVNKTTTAVVEETQTTLPWGTANDFSVQSVVSASNSYMETFEGVVVDSSLNLENACWTLYVSSYAYESESSLLARVKDTARFQYERCVASGNLNYDTPLRMYVKAVPNFNKKLNATYYEFYILYMV